MKCSAQSEHFQNVFNRLTNGNRLRILIVSDDDYGTLDWEFLKPRHDYKHIHLNDKNGIEILRKEIELNPYDYVWNDSFQSSIEQFLIEGAQLPTLGNFARFSGYTKLDTKKCIGKTPKFAEFTWNDEQDSLSNQHALFAALLRAKLYYPLIVKPNNYSGSQFVNINSIVMTPQQCFMQVYECTQSIVQANGADTVMVIEEYIEGPEFTILCLENCENAHEPVIDSLMQIDFGSTEYKFKHERSKQTLTTFPVNDIELVHKIKEFAKQIFTSLKISNFARLDLRLDVKTNDLYLIDVTSYVDPSMNRVDLIEHVMKCDLLRGIEFYSTGLSLFV
jgi:hypothetical protein